MISPYRLATARHNIDQTTYNRDMPGSRYNCSHMRLCSTDRVPAAFYAHVTSNFAGKCNILARIGNPSIVCYITYVNYNLQFFRCSFRISCCLNFVIFKLQTNKLDSKYRLNQPVPLLCKSENGITYVTFLFLEK